MLNAGRDGGGICDLLLLWRDAVEPAGDAGEVRLGGLACAEVSMDGGRDFMAEKRFSVALVLVDVAVLPARA